MSPEYAPLRWQEVDWSGHVHDVDVAGRRMRYLEYGSGPPMVLVHGLGGAWTTWLANLVAFGEHHRVIAVDLPGFGGSDPLPGPPDLAEHHRAVATLLDTLDVRDAVVVGHSLGGLVVLGLADERPDLVGRLVLANAGGVPLSRLRLLLITRAFILLFALLRDRPGVLLAVVKRPRARRLALAGMVADPAAIPPEIALETVPLIAATGFLAAVEAGAAAVATVRPEDVHCPTLLLWGREDRVLPLATAEALLGRIPDARLEVIDGAAHCPMFELPDVFNAAVLAFTGP